MSSCLFALRPLLLLLALPQSSGLTRGSSRIVDRVQPQLQWDFMPGVNASRHDKGDDKKKKLKVEIFYEAMCPFCMQYMSTDLQQLWQHEDLREHIDLYLFPYGNSATYGASGAYTFDCQHGDDECRGNLIEACSTQLLDGPDNFVPFVGCIAATAQQYDIKDSARACAKQQGVDMPTIGACVDSAAGNEFMAQIGTYSDTMSAGKEYVPWVLVNGEHDKQADMGRQLTQVVCSALAQKITDVPAICAQQALSMQRIQDADDVNVLPEDKGGVCWTPGREPSTAQRPSE